MYCHFCGLQMCTDEHTQEPNEMLHSKASQRQECLCTKGSPDDLFLHVTDEGPRRRFHAIAQKADLPPVLHDADVHLAIDEGRLVLVSSVA